MKKGFTLIELLAVIVILAIIALIATPIILNIIKNTKVQSSKVSAEFYIDAVTQKIAVENLDNEFNPSYCELENDKLMCDEKEVKVEIDGEMPSEVKLNLKNGRVTAYEITISGEKITTGTVTEPSKPIATALTVATSGEYTIGDKYSVSVNDELDLDFYILSKNLDENGNIESVNLLMSQNLGTDGNYADSTDDNVAWYSTSRTNENGPLTAIQFLEDYTITWTNVPEIETYTYVDDGGGSKYTSITKENIKARLPKYSEMTASEVGCTGYSGSCPAWAISYLYYNDIYKPSKYVDGAVDASFETVGYLTSAAHSSSAYSAWYVYSYANVGYSNVDSASYGVRPVITLSISQLSQ